MVKTAEGSVNSDSQASAFSATSELLHTVSLPMESLWNVVVEFKAVMNSRFNLTTQRILLVMEVVSSLYLSLFILVAPAWREVLTNTPALFYVSSVPFALICVYGTFSIFRLMLTVSNRGTNTMVIPRIHGAGKLWSLLAALWPVLFCQFISVLQVLLASSSLPIILCCIVYAVGIVPLITILIPIFHIFLFQTVVLTPTPSAALSGLPHVVRYGFQLLAVSIGVASTSTTLAYLYYVPVILASSLCFLWTLSSTPLFSALSNSIWCIIYGVHFSVALYFALAEPAVWVLALLILGTCAAFGGLMLLRSHLLISSLASNVGTAALSQRKSSRVHCETYASHSDLSRSDGKHDSFRSTTSSEARDDVESQQSDCSGPVGATNLLGVSESVDVTNMDDPWMFIRVMVPISQLLVLVKKFSSESDMDPVAEEVVRLFEAAIEKWSGCMELRILYAHVLHEISLLLDEKIWILRMNRVLIAEASLTSRVDIRFEMFFLQKLRQRCIGDQDSFSSDARSLRKRLRKVDRLRSLALGFQAQFWKTLLVDAQNHHSLTSLIDRMDHVSRDAMANFKSIEATYGMLPEILRSKARYFIDVYGDVSYGQEMLLRADQVEERAAKTSSGHGRQVRPSESQEEDLSSVPDPRKQISIFSSPTSGDRSQSIATSPAGRKDANFGSAAHLSSGLQSSIPIPGRSAKQPLRSSFAEKSILPGGDSTGASDTDGMDQESASSGLAKVAAKSRKTSLSEESESERDFEAAELSSASSGSVQAAITRSKQIRDDFMARESRGIRRMRLMIFVSIFVCFVVFVAFFTMTIVLVQHPLSHLDVRSGLPTEDDPDALSYSFEAVNRLSNSLFLAGTLSKKWVDGLVEDHERANLLRVTESTLEDYKLWFSRTLRRKPQNEDAIHALNNRFGVSSFAADPNLNYWNWTMKTEIISAVEVLQAVQNSFSEGVACLKAHSVYSKVFNSSSSTWISPTISAECTKNFVFVFYNANGGGMEAVKHFEENTALDLRSRTAVLEYATIAICLGTAITLLVILFCILFPSVRLLENEREAMLRLIASIDVSALKKIYEESKSRAKSSKTSSRQSSAAGRSGSESQKSQTSSFVRTKFSFAIIVLIVYLAAFAVLLGLYIGDVFSINEEVEYFSSTQESASRADFLALSLFSSTASPLGDFSQRQERLSVLSTEIVHDFQKFIVPSGEHSQGIVYLSPELHAAFLDPSCTFYSFNVSRSDCRSLQAVISDMSSLYNSFSFGTAMSSSAPRELAFSETYLSAFTDLTEVVPYKLNFAYNNFVQYYNDRVDIFRLLCIFLFSAGFLLLPLVLCAGLVFPLMRLSSAQRQFRSVFLLIPLDYMEQEQKIWMFVSGTEDEEVVLNLHQSKKRSSLSKRPGRADAEHDEEALRRVLDSSTDAFFELDLKGNIRNFNSSACAISRRMNDELLGSSLEDILADGQRLRSIVHSKQVGSLMFETNCIASSGEVICPVRLNVRVVSSAPEQQIQKGSNVATSELDKANTGKLFIHVFMRDITEEQRQNILLNEEKSKSMALLRNMMPLPVASKLMRGDRPIAYEHDAVCCLFCDIKNFTPLAASLGAASTVHMLDSLVGQCDDVCERRGITKVKTIGDCLFLCAGIIIDGEPIDPGMAQTKKEDLRKRNVVLDMVETGLEIIKIAEALQIQVRIGLHIGPVISGVIGKVKYQFDLWGDVVNVASRMESSSTEMRIHMSRDAYEKVYEYYECDEREVHVKGKGVMNTYLLVARRPDPMGSADAPKAILGKGPVL
eukprot:ANDGO_03104.mRNA.1 Adenylate cyclase